MEYLWSKSIGKSLWTLENNLTLVLLNKLRCHTHLIFKQSGYLIWIVATYLMANSAEPDQLASSEANWSGSTLFAEALYIWVQQDKG